MNKIATSTIRSFQSDISFECPSCAREVQTNVPVPELFYVFPDTVSDEVSIWDSDVECPSCQTIFTAIVTHTETGVSACLRGHIDIPLAVSAPYYTTNDGYYEEDPPENPFNRYRDAIAELRDVLHHQGDNENGSALINRMVFTQHIAAFEAYLAETLVKCVTGNTETMISLLANDRNLKERKFTLHEVITIPDLLSKEVRSYLRSVVYHQLPKVDALYKSALNISVLKGRGDKDALFNAIERRHDCIHRNGYTVEGERLDIFSKEYIGQICRILEEIVHRLEAAINFEPLN